MHYCYKRKFVKFIEIWNNPNEKIGEKADVVIFKFINDPPLSNKYYKGYNIIFDLTKNEDELLSNINHTTRKGINRAKTKDNILCETWYSMHENNDKKLIEYVDFKNKANMLKNIDIMSDVSEMKLFNGNLCIRRVLTRDSNTVLAVHSYIVSDSIAMGLHFVSHFRESKDGEYRNLVGRANRLLHWDDILYFKSIGLTYYNMGGWSTDKANIEQQKINEFKESFGGTITLQYSYVLPITLLGKIYCLVISMKNKIQNTYGFLRKSKKKENNI
jgi:lipid II:glycine glycyltransferase (peptidoglycan interpeptide bridge formation enzyme)